MEVVQVEQALFTESMIHHTCRNVATPIDQHICGLLGNHVAKKLGGRGGGGLENNLISIHTETRIPFGY